MAINDNNNLGVSIVSNENGGFSLIIDFGDWKLSKTISEYHLDKLEAQILDAKGLTEIMNTFSCSSKEADQIKSYWNRIASSCRKCKLKNVECHKCVNVCQSPLEQDMFKEFRNRGIDVILQRRIRKDGTWYDAPEEVDADTILTIPDFYLESGNSKLCIYADGKTYHYNNESQGMRDRNIDIALQNLGYKVLRYTGSQIRNDIGQVIDSVVASIGN